MPKNYRIVKIGIGAGNKDFDHANILRAMLIEEEEEEKTDGLELLETNLDDCTGEALGYTCLLYTSRIYKNRILKDNHTRKVWMP